jgi:hypothetical protein
MYHQSPPITRQQAQKTGTALFLHTQNFLGLVKIHSSAWVYEQQIYGYTVSDSYSTHVIVGSSSNLQSIRPTSTIHPLVVSLRVHLLFSFDILLDAEAATFLYNFWNVPQSSLTPAATRPGAVIQNNSTGVSRGYVHGYNLERGTVALRERRVCCVAFVVVSAP